MTHNAIDIVGKNVKDMYGTLLGKVIGTMTDIDGTIQSVGVDCGPQGLQQIRYEQLVVQSDVVIFIPKWRLDSQTLLREKQLTARRLKALIDIVSENSDMKEDATIIHEKYKSKLTELEATEHMVKAKLETRLTELEEQAKSAKMILFDAKVQFKSSEIEEDTFDMVKFGVSELLEHVNHEIAEIQNVQKRIIDLDGEVQEMTTLEPVQESAASYLRESVQSILPEAPTEPVDVYEKPVETYAAKTPDTYSTPNMPKTPEYVSEAYSVQSNTPEATSESDDLKVPTFENTEIPEPPKTPTFDNADIPEPPKNTPSNKDDDWLARMEAQ